VEELGTRESSGIPLAVDVVLSMPFLDVQEILEGRRGGNIGERCLQTE
jgi:hypothetical protein